MWANSQKTVDLVISTEEFLNGKLHFCAVRTLLCLGENIKVEIPERKEGLLDLSHSTKLLGS